MPYTDNLNLYKPRIGETGWGSLVNTNFDLLDVHLEGWVNSNKYASINAAVTAIGSTVTTLNVTEAETLTDNLVIPSTLRLRIEKGGSIVKASTYTVAINGTFEAGLYQVFSGFSAGDVTFGTGSVKELYPVWWGENTTPGTTDMTDEINLALNAGQIIELSGDKDTVYLVDGIVVPQGKTLKGNATLKLKNNASNHLISFTGVVGTDYHTKIMDITLDGNKANNTGKRGISYNVAGNYLDILDCVIKDTSDTSIFITASATSLDFNIKRNKIIDPGGRAIQLVDNLERVKIIDNELIYNSGNTQEAIAITAAGSLSNHIEIKNNKIYWANTTGDDAISLAGGEFIEVVGNFITQGDKAINVAADHVLIGNNTLQGNFGDDAITINGSDYVVVNGNILYVSSGSPAGSGIHLTNAPTNISITGNVIREAIDGIEIDGIGTPHSIEIVGNNITEMDNRGINVSIPINNIVITGNIVRNTQKTGIWVAGGNNTVVTSNVVIDANLSNTASENGITVSNSIAGRVVKGNSFNGCLHPSGGVYEDVSRSFTTLDATPSIANGNVFKTANGGATTITTFTDGISGEKYIILIGDANTIIDFTGTNLEGNAGADWSPTTGDWMECFYDGTNYYCSVHDTTA